MMQISGVTGTVGIAIAMLAGPALADEPIDERDYTGQPLLYEDFAGDEPGEVHADLAADHRMEVVSGEGRYGGPALRVAYVGFDRGSERLVQRFPLAREVDEATMNYHVRFDEDFQFVGGGKMHGLGPENPIAGGGDMVPDRWSARINFRREGGTSTYIYSQNKDTPWGEAVVAEDFNFEPGQYHAVSLYVRINDPGQDNGIAHIYIDGERVVTHEGIEYRGDGVDEARIHHLLFSTFHGGSAPRWAPTDEDGEYVTVYATYDNFAVYEGKVIRSE